MTNLTILNQEIKIRDGLFSLNDLHRASGEAEKHKPSRFMRLDSTKDLIAEINSENNQRPDMVLAFKSFRGGKTPGTYVCKELVYSYAMWISAKFSLLVIRTFDQLANKTPEQPKIGKTDSDDRVPLRNAVSKLVSSKGLLYPDAYTLVHQHFGIKHIDELTYEQIPQAVEYVHRLITSNAIEGELMPRKTIKQRKDQSDGLALMMHGENVKTVQNEKLREVEKLLNTACMVFNEAMRCNGAIWDGLYESRMYMDFTPQEREKAQQQSDKHFEDWKKLKHIM